MTTEETFWPEEAVKITIDNLKIANVPVGGKLECLFFLCTLSTGAVSYTHLTLPTKA